MKVTFVFRFARPRRRSCAWTWLTFNSMDDGLYFALTFLRAAVPVLCLASLVSSFIGSVRLLPLLASYKAQCIAQLFARLFSSLQARGFGAESTEDEPASTPAVERRPLLDENGIAPVVVREKSRRSWLLITLFCLIALSYAADGVVLIADAVIEREWETETPLFHLLDFYIVGSFLAFALMALAMSWQRIKGRRGPAERATPVVLAGLATAGEVSMLGVMAALYRDVFRGHIPLYPALHLAILVVRLFHLLFLLLSFTPLLQRSTFKPLALTNGSSYGTFAANAKADEPTTDKPVAPVPPDASFATLMHRIRVLAPYLWPKKSVLLQVIAGTCFAILVVGRIINPLVPAQLGAVVEDLRTERCASPSAATGRWSSMSHSALEEPRRLRRPQIHARLRRHPQRPPEQPLDQCALRFSSALSST